MPQPEPDPELIERAAAIIRRGGLVAYPTDTVYGLAADPANDEAMYRLFEAKKRDPNEPVPLLIASDDGLAAIASATPEPAQRLISLFWPGALTIVLPKAPSFHSIGVRETVGVRVPDHPVPRALARALGGPITGTSANVAGAEEPLTAGDVRGQLADTVDLVIDGGRCPGNRPSTVVDCTVDPPRILREGAISRAEVEGVTPLAD